MSLNNKQHTLDAQAWDIKSHITSFMTPKDLANLSVLNKGWYVLTADERLWIPRLQKDVGRSAVPLIRHWAQKNPKSCQDIDPDNVSDQELRPYARAAYGWYMLKRQAILDKLDACNAYTPSWAWELFGLWMDNLLNMPKECFLQYLMPGYDREYTGKSDGKFRPNYQRVGNSFAHVYDHR